MVNRYITTISDIDPETALQWAGTIENENRRKNSMLIAAAGLLETEGEAAVAKLKALGMTEGMIKAAPQHAILMKKFAGQGRMQGMMVIDESTVSFGAPPSKK